MHRLIVPVLVLLLVPMAGAQSGSPYDPQDYGEYEDYGQYDGGCFDGLEIDADDPDEVHYEYVYVCESQVRVAEFEFTTNTAPGFALEAVVVDGYDGQGQSAQSSPEGNVAAMELHVDLLGVAVFEDSDGDGAFGPDDEALEQEGFSPGRWSSISASQTDGRLDFDVEYDLEMGGTFRVVGTAQVAPFTAGGIRVQPGDTKIDFEFHDLPFASTTAKAALVLGIDSEVAAVQAGGTHGIQGREEGVVIGGQQSAYFTWAKTAKVDGVDRPVRSFEQLESESANVNQGGTKVDASEVQGVVSLAYEQGSKIIHDPRLGVAFSKSGSNGAPGVGILIVPALLGLALWRRDQP